MQKKEKIKIGLALFLIPNDTRDNIYFEDKLPNRFKNNQEITTEIVKLRNILVIMTIMEIFSAIWGLFYFFFRRVKNFIYFLKNI